MIRSHKFLSLVLALQLLLVVSLFWPRSQPAEGIAGSALLDLGDQQVSRVVISTADNNVILDRSGNNWQMPEYHRLPVDPAKMDALLTQLPQLPRGWPVAQTGAAQQRFEVAEDSFQRKLHYFHEEQDVGSIFLGTSPGFRKVHARPGDAGEVYSVEFNTFDLPAEPSAWMDKTVLQLEQVDSVTGLDYTISRSGESWNDESGQAADTTAAGSLVNGLQSIRVSGVADPDTASILNDVQAPPTLSVESGDRSLEYRLYEMDDAYYVRRADVPVYLSLSALDYDRLNDASASVLFPVAEAVETVEASDPEGTAVGEQPSIDD
jgi:hypothetical protein